MRLLSIDPSLRCSGFAVLEQAVPGGKLQALEYGTIRNPDRLTQTTCLVAIHDRISALITQYQPDAAAIETIIYVQSHRTAITLGAARGAALLALAQRQLTIAEYPPARVKQAVVGKGSATKDQVAFMVRALLGLTETPQSDAADALAIGITHFHQLAAARMGISRTRSL